MGQEDLKDTILDAVHQQTGTESGHGSTVLRSTMNRLLSSRTVDDVPVAHRVERGSLALRAVHQRSSLIRNSRTRNCRSFFDLSGK